MKKNFVINKKMIGRLLRNQTKNSAFLNNLRFSKKGRVTYTLDDIKGNHWHIPDHNMDVR